MATAPAPHGAFREDLLDFSSALYLHDHELIRAVYARHPGVDIMSSAASLFVQKSNAAGYEANIDSLRRRIQIADAGTHFESRHLFGLMTSSAHQGFAHLASYVYERCSRYGPSFKSVDLTLELLCELGWTPCEKALYEFSQAAIAAKHAAGLLWVAKRGLKFSAQPLEKGFFFRSPPTAFLNPSADDLAILGQLCDLGSLIDADSEVGLTDFIEAQAYKAASVLASKGFKPRPTACKVPGVNPVCSYINSLSHAIDSDEPSRREARSNQITATLEWLASNGADFSPSPDPLLTESAWSPFFAASSIFCLFNHHHGAGQSAQARRLFSDLKRLGANPNASGGFIHNEIKRLHCINLDTGFFQAALDVGADPGLHPGPALSAIASWDRPQPVWAEALEKLAALGATPELAPTSCPAYDHPLAAAIDNRKIPYAKHLLSAGIDSSWTDSRNGTTLWHLLALQAGAFSVPMMARLANDPATLALIDAPRQDGSTALHLACAALNTAQAKALLDAGANPLLQDSAGQSPLHCAGRKFGAKTKTKMSNLIALLISRGADPSLLNKNGLTAGQAMAKSAPLDGLAILLNARPEDLIDGSAASISTQAAVSLRGAQAVSIVESAILGSNGDLSRPPHKPKRQRL